MCSLQVFIADCVVLPAADDSHKQLFIANTYALQTDTCSSAISSLHIALQIEKTPDAFWMH